ncbi:MAG: site-2 protease family protein [Candidatus Woesebacteria bacterium]|nr:site-2 protease family protein [Candidatus Woesebacteria bacterium]
MTMLFLILAFAITITVHEAAHAWMANRLGDPTAKLSGRLSLNPLVHYDPAGTTLLIITAILWYFHKLPFPFGWAKPVQFDPYNLKNPQRDSALISFAGPGANLILAIILSIIRKLSLLPFSPFSFLLDILPVFIVLNISLAIFNLIPIHPLDGGKILVGLLPSKKAHEVDIFLNRFGFIILIALIFPIFGNEPLINTIISPIIKILISILIPGNLII